MGKSGTDSFKISYAHSVRKLESDEGRALLRFRGELVLQLFLKHGSFWDAVQDILKLGGI